MSDFGQMTADKKLALKIIEDLYDRGRLEFSQLCIIGDAISDIAPLRDRDVELEQLWDIYADTPMDAETECIVAPFLHFPVGTNREDIWHWFDERHSKGVAYLMYNGIEDYVPETRRLYGLKKLCVECESKDCQFNHGGECRFALVHEVKPSISDETGCLGYEYRETELL